MLEDEVSYLKSENNALNTQIRRLKVNLNFNKEFNDYFPKIIKEIKEQISPDLFQIEPFNNEEMPNLINLIKTEEKYEEKLFQEVKNIIYEYDKKINH